MNHRMEEIIARRDKAFDPEVGYVFAERPTWNDIDYLLSCRSECGQESEIAVRQKSIG